jgi:membrane protein required for colicin V production
VNGFDAALIVLAGALVLLGAMKGLARIAMTAASLVVAFLLASRLQAPVARAVAGLGAGPTASGLVAYVVIFLATMVCGAVATWFVRRLLRATRLSRADRVAGGVAGLAAAALAAAFVVHPIAASSGYGAELLHGSRLAPFVARIADVADLLAPSDLSARYREGIDGVRRLWERNSHR